MDTLGTTPAFLVDAAWSPDSQWAAFLTFGGELCIHDVSRGKHLWQTDPNQSHEGCAAISSDAAWLAVSDLSCRRNRIQLRNARTGDFAGALVGHQGNICGLGFASHGALYSWDSQGVIIRWDMDRRRPIWQISCAPWVAPAH
jgi:WD40 repeat protein